MEKFKEFWKKIRAVKHFELYLALIAGLIVVCCYFFFFMPSSNKKEESSTQNYSTAQEYASYLENKLCNVLSTMEGVGRTSAIITLDGGFTYVYATNSETNTTTSGSAETSVTVDTTIIENGEPVVVKVNYPTIKGVVIVAEGSEDFAIKMDILEAVETLLDVGADKITILS